MLGLYDNYRNALMNSMYYATRLKRYKRADLWADITVALTTSSAFGGLAIWHAQLGKNLFSGLLAISVIVSTLRPVLRLSDRIARYSKLHYGYLEIYYRIQALISDVQGVGQLTLSHEAKIGEIADTYRALELEADAAQNRKELLRLQDEVEEVLPADRMWLPSE